MSASKAARRRPKRTPNERRTAPRPSDEDIENVRLELIGVVATCELVRSSYTATRSAGIVLTRGAMQPLFRALELLGDENPDFTVTGHRRANCEGGGVP